jgi:hypothetical protein
LPSRWFFRERWTPSIGGYEIVRRDTTHHEHHVTIQTGTDRITSDLITWLAARDLQNTP